MAMDLTLFFGFLAAVQSSALTAGVSYEGSHLSLIQLGVRRQSNLDGTLPGPKPPICYEPRSCWWDFSKLRIDSFKMASNPPTMRVETVCNTSDIPYAMDVLITGITPYVANRDDRNGYVGDANHGLINIKSGSSLTVEFSLIKSDSPAQFCKNLPPSMNGGKFMDGCPGAVWQNGKGAKSYCTNTGISNGRFAWWAACCKWDDQHSVCVPKNQPLPVTAECKKLPPSMNGGKFMDGCPGAVWQNGKGAKSYCTNTGISNGRFAWWAACCKWDDQHSVCVPKNQPLPVTAEEIDFAVTDIDNGPQGQVESVELTGFEWEKVAAKTSLLRQSIPNGAKFYGTVLGYWSDISQRKLGNESKTVSVGYKKKSAFQVVFSSTGSVAGRNFYVRGKTIMGKECAPTPAPA